MISLCQDVSISYEYHVYENKTVKKIIHKRNGSNISEKTFVKASKLSLVSKDKEKVDLKGKEDQKIVLQSQKNVPDHKQKKKGHKRCWSNHVNPATVLELQKKNQAASIQQNKSQLFPINMTSSYQVRKEPNKPQVYFNRPLQESFPQQRFYIKQENQPLYTNFDKPVLQNNIISSGNLRPVRFLQSQRQKTFKIQPYTQRSFKVNQQDIFQKINFNHTRANSFTTHQTVLKQNLQKVQSSTIEDFISMEKQFVDSSPQNSWTLRQNSLNIQNESPRMICSLEEQRHTIRQNYSFADFNTRNIDFQNSKKDFQHFLKSPIKIQHENIFDAESTISNNLNDENESECHSVVQQRNFFFQKQQEPMKSFKKSLQNYIFLESGCLSSNKKWVLFKNVQDKENCRTYSVKQFPSGNENQYLNEYENYLALKGQTSQFVFQSKNNSLFLNLFNVLSDNKHNKFYLIKQNFELSLSDYINALKKQNTLKNNSTRALQIENAIIQNQIMEVLQFFQEKEFQISNNQELQIEDFVVCKSLTGKYSIKFHSLYKLFKKRMEKYKFSKFSKLKKQYQDFQELKDLNKKYSGMNFSQISRKVFDLFFSY